MLSTASASDNDARSYKILDKARQQAFKQTGYDSHATRTQLTSIFEKRFGKTPYAWQLDVTEAMLLGLDSIVIAGTGSGKTMPFMMALLLDTKKKIVIISPLKILQADQATRFEKMDISTVAVNGETWSQALKKDLDAGHYQGLYLLWNPLTDKN